MTDRKTHFTLVPEDSLIAVDGEFVHFSEPIPMPERHVGIHAVQWHEGRGEVEFKGGSPNLVFTSDSDYGEYVQPYVEMFDAEKARLEEERIENERLAKEFYESEEQRWVRLRAKRDQLIADTDYVLMPDYPVTEECREAFRSYRQALRDITANPAAPWDGDEIPWPTKPDIVRVEG